jgi:hypothetical protein
VLEASFVEDVTRDCAVHDPKHVLERFRIPGEQEAQRER